MSFTNCLANIAGLLAPIAAGYIIHGKVSYVVTTPPPFFISLWGDVAVGEKWKIKNQPFLAGNKRQNLNNKVKILSRNLRRL